MKSNKRDSLKTREKVLKVLSTSSLGKLTPDEILVVLKEDGVKSLKDLVTRLIEITKDSAELSSSSPSRINLQLLSRQTPKEIVSTIVHRLPKVPFVLNGTEYDPKDIRRFNGRELHFIVGSQAVRQGALLAFEDRSILTSWLQMIYLNRLSGLDTASALPSESLGGGRLLEQVYNCPPGFNCYVVFQPPIPPPPPPPAPDPAILFQPPTAGERVPAEVTMYELYGLRGLGLRLPPGYNWPDLTQVTRYNVGWYYSTWNDAISSLHKTSSVCAYFEDVNFGGTVRIVVPHVWVFDLDILGFDDTISSVMNFG